MSFFFIWPYFDFGRRVLLEEIAEGFHCLRRTRAGIPARTRRCVGSPQTARGQDGLLGVQFDPVDLRGAIGFFIDGSLTLLPLRQEALAFHSWR